MRRGPMIHGVLLVAALIFAYQTWTREEKVARKTGDVVVWTVSADAVTAVAYDTKDRTTRLEKRQDGAESYFWGSEARSHAKPKPPAAKNQDAGPEAVEAEEPATEEIETDNREFAVGETAKTLIENLASLRALRDLGQPSDADLAEYGITESKDNLTITYQGGSQSLVLGSKVYGSTDRYARNPATGKAYVLSGETLKDLLTGEAGLRLRKMHEFPEDKLAKAVVSASGKTRSLVQMTVVEEEGQKVKNWADAAAPGKPDQTMSNFLQNVDKLIPTRYEPGVDPSQLTLITRVEYQDTQGKSLGWLELYSKEPEPAAGSTPAGATPAPATPAPATPAPATPASAAQPAAPAAKPADPAAKPADPAAKPAAPAAKPADQAAKPADPAAKPGEPKPEPGAKPAEPPAPEPPKPTYYLRTELTRTLASVSPSAATRITDDIAQIFGQ